MIFDINVHMRHLRVFPAFLFILVNCFSKKDPDILVQLGEAEAEKSETDTG